MEEICITDFTGKGGGTGKYSEALGIWGAEGAGAVGGGCLYSLRVEKSGINLLNISMYIIHLIFS